MRPGGPRNAAGRGRPAPRAGPRLEPGIEVHDSGAVMDPWVGRIAATDGMFVTDDRQRIVAWSSAAQRMLGFSRTRPSAGPATRWSWAASRTATRSAAATARSPATPGAGAGRRATRSSRGPGTAARSACPTASSWSRGRTTPSTSSTCSGSRVAPAPVVRRERRPGPGGSPTTAMVETLTRRELEVLRHFAAGSTIDEIAEALSISVFTARNHISNVGRKLGARSRLEIVLLGHAPGPGVATSRPGGPDPSLPVPPRKMVRLHHDSAGRGSSIGAGDIHAGRPARAPRAMAAGEAASRLRRGDLHGGTRRDRWEHRMDPLDLARWQFGITTVYHFLFVPLTIGLAFSVAGFQTAWYRTGKESVPAAHPVLRRAVPDQLRAGRRDRHRPGVPVRHELEQLQPVRGRHLRGAAGHRGPARLLPRVHVPGPLDLRLGPAQQARPPRHDLDRRHRARRSPRTSSWPPTPGCSTPWATRSTPSAAARSSRTSSRRAQQHGPDHVPAHDRRRVHDDGRVPRRHRACTGCSRTATGPRPPRRSAAAAKAGAVMLLVSGLLVAVTGDIQGKIMTDQQPMKMAAAEAPVDDRAARVVLDLHHRQRSTARRTCSPSGSRTSCRSSPPATSTARSRASTTSRPRSRPSSGPGDYTPNTPVTYWTFRLMIGTGALAALAAAWFLFRMRKGATPARPHGAGRGGAAVPARSPPTRSPGCSPRSAASPGSCSA